MNRICLIITILLSVILAQSCSNNPIAETPDIQTISIHDFRNYLTDEKFTDLATDIEYIPLETSDNCLLGRSIKIQESNGIYYLKSNNKVYRFDSKGNFINKIGRIGNGPGEYTGIRSFQVSSETDELWIISDNRKILVYSSEGEFVRQFEPVDTVINDKWSMYITKDQALFDGLYTGGYTAMRYSQSGELIEPLSYRIIYHTVGGKSFFQRKSDVLYKTKFCDTIFRITPKQFVPELRLDFGSSTITWDDRLSFKKGKGNCTDVPHRYYSINFQGFSDNYLISFFTVANDKKIEAMGTPREIGYNPETHFLLYNLTTNLAKIVPYYGFNDQTNLFLRGGIISMNNEDRFCTFCQPMSLHSSKEEIIDQHGETYFRKNYPKLDELCNEISMEDNPILITFSLNF